MPSSAGNDSRGAEATPSSPQQLANVSKRANPSTAKKVQEWKDVSPARLRPTTREVASRMLPVGAVKSTKPIPKAKLFENFQEKQKRPNKSDRKRRIGLFTRVSDEPLAEIDHAALETSRFPRCNARNCKRDCCNGAFSKLPHDMKCTYLAKVRQFYRDQYAIGKSHQVDVFLRQFIQLPVLPKDGDGASTPAHLHAKFFLPSLKPNSRRICTSREFWRSVFCISRDKVTKLVRSLLSSDSVPPENRGGARYLKPGARAAVVAALTDKLAVAEDHDISFRDKHNLRLQEGVCWTDVWKLACKKLDEDFYQRCQSAGYWPGKSRLRLKPTDWPDGLAAPISYSSARTTMKMYNVFLSSDSIPPGRRGGAKKRDARAAVRCSLDPKSKHKRPKKSSTRGRANSGAPAATR